jgi:hypothetical protein
VWHHGKCCYLWRAYDKCLFKRSEANKTQDYGVTVSWQSRTRRQLSALNTYVTTPLARILKLFCTNYPIHTPELSYNIQINITDFLTASFHHLDTHIVSVHLSNFCS